MLSVIATSLSIFFAKFAYMENKALTGFDYMFTRTPIMILITLIQAWVLKVDIFKIEPEARKWIALRCFFGTTAMPWFFVGLKYLPSSKATFIKNLQPLMISFGGYLFLKEKISKIDFIAIYGAFIGIIIMNYKKTDSSKIDSTSELVTFGIILCSLNSVLASGSMLTLRKMNQYVHYMINASYFAFSLLILSFILLLFRPSLFHFEAYTFSSVFWMMLSGVIIYVGQTLGSIAYKYEEASKMSPFAYTSGIFLMIADILIFNYDFNLTDVIGILVVFISLLIPIIIKGYYHEI